MPPPFDLQRALDARFDDLKEFIKDRLDDLDDRLVEQVQQTEKNTKDITRIKAYWTAGTFAVGLAFHQLKDVIAAALGYHKGP